LSLVIHVEMAAKLRDWLTQEWVASCHGVDIGARFTQPLGGKVTDKPPSSGAHQLLARFMSPGHERFWAILGGMASVIALIITVATLTDKDPPQVASPVPATSASAPSATNLPTPPSSTPS
jgi:hypothetical protein